MSQTSFQQYTKIRIIGTGVASIVYLVSTIEDNKRIPYALKVINKGYAAKLKQIQHIKAEKKIHLTLDHPFIVKL